VSVTGGTVFTGEFGAGESIEADPLLRGGHGQLAVDLRGNTHAELATVLALRERLGHGLMAGLELSDDLADQLANAAQGLFGGCRQPA